MPTKIDYVDETIQPTGWGCYGPKRKGLSKNICSYCYAYYKFAKRRLSKCPQCNAFTPHWHPEQLEKPLHWRKPRRILVQNMGDLFGDWNSHNQIQEVINIAILAPQHTYLFLTKNSYRYHNFSFSNNCWIGCTHTGVIHQEPGGAIVEWGILHSSHPNKFISFEPLLSEPDITSLNKEIQWIIIGARSGVDARDYIPQKKWVEKLITIADKDQIPVFIKQSIYKRYPDIAKRKEYPW